MNALGCRARALDPSVYFKLEVHRFMCFVVARIHEHPSAALRSVGGGDRGVVRLCGRTVLGPGMPTPADHAAES